MFCDAVGHDQFVLLKTSNFKAEMVYIYYVTDDKQKAFILERVLFSVQL